MKKILFYIYSLNKGGAERVVLTLARKLHNDKKYDVAILTDAIADNEYDLPDGIKRIHISEYMGNKLSVGVDRIDRLMAIRKCINQEKPDKIVAFMVPAAKRAISASVFTKNKIIAAVRFDPYDSYGEKNKRNRLIKLFKKAEKVVCQTEYQREFFTRNPDVSIPEENCKVIFNPISDDFYMEPYSGERDRVIVATGRLEEFKNHKLLIRAFSKISDEFSDVKLIIYGEGPYRGEIEATIATLPEQIQKRILLPGDSKKVAEDIKKAMMYVLSSDAEGMPNALLEALSMGLPCISTDCLGGGAASLINDEVNGILVPIQDEEKMAEAMRRILSDKEIRESLGHEALKIRDVCSAEAIVNQWDELL